MAFSEVVMILEDHDKKFDHSVDAGPDRLDRKDRDIFTQRVERGAFLFSTPRAFLLSSPGVKQLLLPRSGHYFARTSSKTAWPKS